MVTPARVVLLSVIVLWVGSALGQGGDSSHTDQSRAEQQIRKVLQQQVEAWNRGDLEGYMAGYWRSPDLTFFSNATETQGWQPTLDRYKARYQGSGKVMGKVSFPELRVTVLSQDSAFVRGQWQLEMPDGKNPHGMFTLLVRKFPEGWRIVHGHSSGE